MTETLALISAQLEGLHIDLNYLKRRGAQFPAPLKQDVPLG